MLLTLMIICRLFTAWMNFFSIILIKMNMRMYDCVTFGDGKRCWWLFWRIFKEILWNFLNGRLFLKKILTTLIKFLLIHETFIKFIYNLMICVKALKILIRNVNIGLQSSKNDTYSSTLSKLIDKNVSIMYDCRKWFMYQNW